MTRFAILLFAMLLQLFADNTYKEFPQSNLDFDSTQFQQERFVSALVPVILNENAQILKDRSFVTVFFDKYQQNSFESKISKADFDKLISTAKKYKISDPFSKKEYDEKVDTVPVSLALSQAVLESGWGESRVAKKANNLFGQKTFTGKKRLVSLDGDVKYAAFDSYIETVKSYMLNLNSHEAYSEFRRKRATAKIDNRLFSGITAAKTLKNYSEIGREYTYMLTEIIQNKFASFDDIKGVYLKNGFDTKMLEGVARM